MNKPEALGDWTYSLVKRLAGRGQNETDWHDFKFGLPDALGLTKLCCSFSNTNGGFIVVGVKQTGNHFIMEGISPDSEIASKFGQKLRADPSIQFEGPRVLKVPRSERVLYIFHVPQSPERPHVPFDADRRTFWKRTHGACEQMTVEEIRAQFMNYEERREKLKLLLIELNLNKEHLESFRGVGENEYSLLTLDSSVLDRLLVDVYSVIQAEGRLVRILLTLRGQIRVTNAATSIFFSQMALPLSNSAKLAQEHNSFMEKKADFLIPLIDEAAKTLEARFNIRNPFTEAVES